MSQNTLNDKLIKKNVFSLSSCSVKTILLGSILGDGSLKINAFLLQKGMPDLAFVIASNKRNMPYGNAPSWRACLSGTKDM
jgi:hypothetical protein